MDLGGIYAMEGGAEPPVRICESASMLEAGSVAGDRNASPAGHPLKAGVRREA